ncbi:AraC family transcriptional regulator [Paenibacillus sp. GYB003]|uniref:AraC family transcriptional regulator n=1 Tax=Paenibacillus sp. GYB003 TaxID=2994392 RepID=UPI002F96AE2C
MSQEVLLCGYSYHTNRFRQSHLAPGLHCYLIRLQTEGACTVLAEGRELRLETGDLLMLRPGTAYEVRVEEAADASAGRGAKIVSGDYYLFCQGDWMDEWWSRSPKPLPAHIELNEALLSLWKQLIVEKCRIQSDSGELMSYLLRALCLQLDRAVFDHHPSYSRSYTAARMKRFVEAHAIETFKVDDLARHVGLSPSRAAHFFKEYYGKTIMQYALEIRLSGAVDRMKYTPMTLAQISDSCGFKSYTFFHRAFKQKYGVSPTAFRIGQSGENRPGGSSRPENAAR